MPMLGGMHRIVANPASKAVLALSRAWMGDEKEIADIVGMWEGELGCRNEGSEDCILGAVVSGE